jgi:hypothetical protein
MVKPWMSRARLEAVGEPHWDAEMDVYIYTRMTWMYSDIFASGTAGGTCLKRLGTWSSLKCWQCDRNESRKSVSQEWWYTGVLRILISQETLRNWMEIRMPILLQRRRQSPHIKTDSEDGPHPNVPIVRCAPLRVDWTRVMTHLPRCEWPICKWQRRIVNPITLKQYDFFILLASSRGSCVLEVALPLECVRAANQINVLLPELPTQVD